MNKFLLFVALIEMMTLMYCVHSFEIPFLPKICKRTLTAISVPQTDPKAVSLISVSTCGDLSNFSGSSKGILFVVMSPAPKLVPAFIAKGFSADTTKLNELKNNQASFFAQFGFITILEYREKNGKQGYQPVEDDIVKTVNLSDLEFTPIKVDWNNDVVNAQYTLSFSATSQNLFSKIEFIVKAVSSKSDSAKSAASKPKSVLTPSMLKFDVSLEGVAYTDTNTRLAIGSIMVARSRASEAEQSTSTSTEETPEQATSTQGALVMPDKDNTLGIFSYKKYATKGKSSTETIEIVRSFNESVQTGDDSFADGGIDTGGEKSMVSLIFSVMEQSANIYWDPAIGQFDPSSASVPYPSVIVLFSLVFTVLMMIN